MSKSARFQLASYLRVDQYISVVLICIVLLLQASYGKSNGSEVGTLLPSQEKFVSSTGELADVPILKTASNKSSHEAFAEFTATISAEAVYVSDEHSAAVLLAKNAETPRAPASTTKLMTALVAKKYYQPADIVTVRQEAFTEGNIMGLQIGEQITVESLLHGLLISSGNDAAFALANHHPFGYDGFIAQMNVTADQLHLDTTSFENPSGLDEPAHQTTARELTILAREVMKDPLLREIVSTQQEVVTDITGEKKHYLVNTHALLGREPGVVGIKTGTTYEAGETLVTQVEKDGRPIIITVLRSQDRYGDTRKIIEWVYSNYAWLPLETNE